MQVCDREKIRTASHRGNIVCVLQPLISLRSPGYAQSSVFANMPVKCTPHRLNGDARWEKSSLAKVITSNSIIVVALAPSRNLPTYAQFGLPTEADILIDMYRSEGVCTHYGRNEAKIGLGIIMKKMYRCAKQCIMKANNRSQKKKGKKTASRTAARWVQIKTFSPRMKSLVSKQSTRKKHQ